MGLVYGLQHSLQLNPRCLERFGPTSYFGKLDSTEEGIPQFKPKVECLCDICANISSDIVDQLAGVLYGFPDSLPVDGVQERAVVCVGDKVLLLDGVSIQVDVN